MHDTYYSGKTAYPPSHSLLKVLQLSLLAILALAFFFAPTAQAAGTNGRNVNVVQFGDFSGKKLGTFRQITRNNWVEQNASGQQTFAFRERNRDDWSVYLYDSSRKVSLQLDLHRKMVRYSDANTPMRDQYKIVGSDSKMSGWLVKNVTFNKEGRVGGAFLHKGNGKWHEISLPNKEVRFNFQEVNRDDWSVYLRDASRNVNIQLDLHTGKVMYSEGNGARRPIYDIAKAR